MIIWLFGNAQTMKKRRARLAGAGVLSSTGTARIWWVFVRNTCRGPRCRSTVITVLGSHMTGLPEVV